MKQVSLYEAKTHLSRLVDEAAAGEEIIITKNGKPLAMLRPLADAPATTIAVTRVKTRHRLPIPYRLRFDDARIKPGRSYALHARITVNGRLWFISATRHAAFTGKPDKTDIRVERVTSEKSAASNPSGKWLAESIHGHGVIANLQTVIDIAADGKVTGSGGCNRIAGKAEISGERISFGPMISTKMACAPAIMDQESKFLAALGDVRHWQLEGQKNKLVLFNANSRPKTIRGPRSSSAGSGRLPGTLHWRRIPVALGFFLPREGCRALTAIQWA